KFTKMKKLLFVCVAVAASVLFTSTTTNAQALKIGYFDDQELIRLFPGIGKVDTLMAVYQSDSLGVEYNYTYADYQHRDSAFKKDSAAMPAKAREMAIKDLNQVKYKLMNWQQYAEQAYNYKMESLLYPYKKRIFDALQEVIKEQKYTYVLNAQALAINYAQPPLLDNLTIRVAMKLKLPLGKEVEDAWKAATGGGAAPAGTKKP
ncbi:MAG: OmpH family outer membrane protein, partial [Bacteroidota bacterium]